MRPSWLPAFIVTAAVVFLQAARPAAAEETPTALAVRPMTAVSAVQGADDRTHLVYELQIVNQSGFLVAIDTVETLDAATKGRLQRLAGGTLASHTIISGGEPGVTFGPAHSGFLLMDIVLAPGTATPAALVHRFTLSVYARAQARDDHNGAPLPDGAPLNSQIDFVGALSPVDPKPALVISPPLKGPNWLVGNGCCESINAHRAAIPAIDGTLYPPERFAIDFVQIGDDGRLFTNEGRDLADYRYYGVPVYSVAGGKIIAAADGDADEIPGALPVGKTLAGLVGNHVIVDIGEGHYAVYAHLKPASIRVAVGDSVKEGDVLGLLGNSGNTSNPHLHFHIMDRPSPLASNPVPFVFKAFNQAGIVSSLDRLFSGVPVTILPAETGMHRTQLPLDNAIIGFPP